MEMWLRNMMGRFCCFSEKVFLMFILALFRMRERGNNPEVWGESFRGYKFFQKKLSSIGGRRPRRL
jgi:hypothetical protein